MLEYNTKYFNRQALLDSIKHAKEVYPEESCGFIIEDKYFPCKNVAKDKLNNYIVDSMDVIRAESEGEVKAVVHSHNGFAHASKKDVEDQYKNDVPYGIINLVNGEVRDLFFWDAGNTLPMAPYEGRPFFYGASDCFVLCRDWYRKELGVVAPPAPRDYGWWLKKGGEKNEIMNGYNNFGFEIIGNDVRDLKKHDIVLAKVNSNVVNHTGVYIGKGLLLHHLCLWKRRLSETVPIHALDDKQLAYILRYKEFI